MSRIGEALGVPSAIAGLVSIGIQCAPVSQSSRRTTPCIKASPPLLERFRDSEGKLEQLGLRLRWYLRSKKVYGCRSALKRQFSPLTPILMALSVDRDRGSTQNHDHVSNIQIRVILESSASSIETLHRHYRSGIQQLSRTGQPQQAPLPPVEDSTKRITGPVDVSFAGENTNNEDDVETDMTETGPSATVGTPNNQSALIPYRILGKKDPSTEETKEIGWQVEETLDKGLDSVSESDIEEMALETYVTEKQFTYLTQQILADLRAEENPEGSGDRSLARKSDSTPHIITQDIEKSWVDFTFIDSGRQFGFPYEEVIDEKGLFVEHLDMGFDFHDRDANEDAVILPRLRARYMKPGVSIALPKHEDSRGEEQE
ncbi:hypothetical protein F4804DRAFT_335736 [Jackrogersella minutella]|nr:hypothetical protein F4804DRAFT_335736 [Jackrogersella minutella]